MPEVPPHTTDISEMPAHDIVVDEKGKPRWVMLSITEFEKLLSRLLEFETVISGKKPKAKHSKAAGYKKMLRKLRK